MAQEQKPLRCQVLFSLASWVKKSNVYVDIFTCYGLFVHVVELYKALVLPARFRRPCASDRQRLTSRASNVTPPRFQDVSIKWQLNLL